jgi:hypothetical protein
MSGGVGFGFLTALARVPGEFIHLVNGQMSGDHGDSSSFLQALQGVGIDRFLEDVIQNGTPVANFTSNHCHLEGIGNFSSAEFPAFFSLLPAYIGFLNCLWCWLLWLVLG